MDSSTDKNGFQHQQPNATTHSTTFRSNFLANVATNDFTKQFATYWKPSTELQRYENWPQTQKKQFYTQKECYHSIYQLKSAFACTNQLISSFSVSKANFEDATRRYTSK